MCPTSIKLVALWGPFHEFKPFLYLAFWVRWAWRLFHASRTIPCRCGAKRRDSRLRTTFPCHCGPTAVLLLFRWSHYYCLLVYSNRFPEPCKSYSRVLDRRRVWCLKFQWKLLICVTDAMSTKHLDPNCLLFSLENCVVFGLWTQHFVAQIGCKITRPFEWGWRLDWNKYLVYNMKQNKPRFLHWAIFQ